MSVVDQNRAWHLFAIDRGIISVRSFILNVSNLACHSE